MGTDPFGRAIRDRHRGQQTAPLLQRDGEQTQEHPIDAFYFDPFPGAVDDARVEWLTSQLDGPLLDAGAGAGTHALYFQEQFETVAIEVSDALVETMADRGVRDARSGDLFALREQFDRDRFRSVLINGTQAGLAGSMQGLRELLGDLAYVTDPEGTVALDGYDPTDETTETLLGFRADPTPGLAYRVVCFEYEGMMSTPLLFRLFSPDRVREATAGTGWTVDAIDRSDESDSSYYRLALTKQ